MFSSVFGHAMCLCTEWPKITEKIPDLLHRRIAYPRLKRAGTGRVAEAREGWSLGTFVGGNGTFWCILRIVYELVAL